MQCPNRAREEGRVRLVGFGCSGSGSMRSIGRIQIKISSESCYRTSEPVLRVTWRQNLLTTALSPPNLLWIQIQIHQKSIEQPQFQQIWCASRRDLLRRLYCTVAEFTRAQSTGSGSGSDQSNTQTRIQSSQIRLIKRTLGVLHDDYLFDFSYAKWPQQTLQLLQFL